MTQLSVVFIWHMHQPYYLDRQEGMAIMPWVRLHSSLGYMDMVAAVEECPGAKVTINLTPSLLKQLRQYIEGDTTDNFLVLSEKPASELTPEERAFVLKFFFMANWDTMVKPYPGYGRLLDKRGNIRDQDYLALQKKFSVQEMRDLVVWFNLSWFGWAAIEMFPVLAELKRKNSGFTEIDKSLVLDCQRQVLQELLPSYGSLWDEGAVEVSSSPMYHPILPLLYDTQIADRARPGVKLPPRFRRPEDATAQIEEGLGYMEAIFGRRPKGMWPSEGSVCHELVPAFLDAGLSWIATDEEILFKRVRTHRRDDALYHPWKIEDQGRELFVFFRDHALSDLVGFTYSRQEPDAAAGDFVRRLREIRSSISRLGQDHAMVAVILDGENPWEAYPDKGRGFLKNVYNRIMETDGLELATASDYLERHPPQRTLDNLPAGSWINNNFDIWIGGPVENKAWHYLGQVRDELPSLLAEAPPEARDEIMDSIRAAEGSDWFWWYGDTFTSDLDHEFDYLFRSHLRQAYLAAGREPPAFLSDSVIFEHSVRVAEEPMDLIEPVIDGKVTDYYEWRAAGHLDLQMAQGAMHQSMRRLRHIHYGFSRDAMYLRLDPLPDAEACEDIEIWIRVDGGRKVVVVLPFENVEGARVHEEMEDGSWKPVGETEAARGKIVEIALPFAMAGAQAGDEVRFVVELHSGERQLERHPRDGYISFTAPGADFDAYNWSV